MDDKTISDIEYCALRFHSGIPSAAIMELFGKNIISSHRELIPENINELISRINSCEDLSKGVRDAAIKLKKTADTINENA